MSGAGQRSALELDTPLLCPVVVDGFGGHGDVELTVTGHRGRCGIKQTKTISTGLSEVKICGLWTLFGDLTCLYQTGVSTQ